MSTDVAIQNGNNNQINVDNQGNLNMLGMQLKISDIIGDKIVDQFMATISPEQMESITRVLFNEVFRKYDKNEYDADSQEYKKIECTEFKSKTEQPKSWGSGYETIESPIYSRAKSTLMTKYSDMISEKVVEYLDSDEYKNKASEIAKDIVNYAIEGYKEDIIKGVRERLVLPVIYPNYNKNNMNATIQQAVCQEISNYNNYNTQKQSY